MSFLKGPLGLGRIVAARLRELDWSARWAPPRQDLTGCITNEELAGLFDRAFGTWHADAPEKEGRRQTPRIPAGEDKPIFLVSYAYDGQEVELNRRARIVDISADGLGIALAESVPVGAVACFAFDSLTEVRSYGVAVVVRSVSGEEGHRIGLNFTESAQTLEVTDPGVEIDICRVPLKGCQRGFNRLREGASAMYRTVTQRQDARTKLEARVYDREASFIVEAKLFRYTAALLVEGREVVRRTGTLHDRLQNLLCGAAVPTLIHLQGGGFSAWATVQANAVTDCDLAVSLPLKQRIREKVR